MSTTIKFEHEAQVKEETYKAGDFFASEHGLYQLAVRSYNSSEVTVIPVINGAECGYCSVESVLKVPRTTVQELLNTHRFTRVSVEITTKPYKELKALKEKIELHRIAEKAHKDEYEKNKRLADQYEFQIREHLNSE